MISEAIYQELFDKYYKLMQENAELKRIIEVSQQRIQKRPRWIYEGYSDIVYNDKVIARVKSDFEVIDNANIIWWGK